MLLTVPAIDVAATNVVGGRPLLPEAAAGIQVPGLPEPTVIRPWGGEEE
jgi:hypothetical protein